MSTKRDDIHKQAILELQYATAAQSIGHVALAMVEANGDYEGASRVLEYPVTRDAFRAAKAHWQAHDTGSHGGAGSGRC